MHRQHKQLNIISKYKQTFNTHCPLPKQINKINKQIKQTKEIIN